jgi:tRNA pseudouridine55 synthase
MPKLEKVLQLDKHPGETPLECLNRFKADNPEYAKEKMTYAGRLDPLASGVLLVLVGEECKNKEKYLKFDKEYELTVLFGLATDSGDVLGLIEEKKVGALNYFGNYKEKDFKDLLRKFQKSFKQKYPRFSSPVIASLAKQSKTGSPREYPRDDRPEKEVEIKKIEFGGFGFVSKKYLRDFTLESIFSVKGNFRQNMIWSLWEKTLETFPDQNLPTLTIKVTCTSGTYMRVLAQSIGNEVGMPALALRIKRTRIWE